MGLKHEDSHTESFENNERNYVHSNENSLRFRTKNPGEQDSY